MFITETSPKEKKTVDAKTEKELALEKIGLLGYNPRNLKYFYAVGYVSGYITVIGPPFRDIHRGKRRLMYPCLCTNCNNPIDFPHQYLYIGLKSCGCIRRIGRKGSAQQKRLEDEKRFVSVWSNQGERK